MKLLIEAVPFPEQLAGLVVVVGVAGTTGAALINTL